MIRGFVGNKYGQDKMSLDELQYDLCTGCGEREPDGRGGILSVLMHSCNANQITYYHGASLRIQHLYDLFSGTNPIQELKNMLIKFPYLKKMPGFKTATDSEKRVYAMIREMEVKQAKRMWEYIKLEHRFYHTLKSGLI